MSTTLLPTFIVQMPDGCHEIFDKDKHNVLYFFSMYPGDSVYQQNLTLVNSTKKISR